MNLDELFTRVAALPGMQPATVPYLVSAVSFPQLPTTATVTLIRHDDGTFTATLGDTRAKAVPATDANGTPLVFADEDAACDWAWKYVRKGRAAFRPLSAEEQARAAAGGDEIRRRMARLEDGSLE